MPDDAERLEILKRVLDGFNRHDLEAIIAHFSDDCVFESARKRRRNITYPRRAGGSVELPVRASGRKDR